MSWKRRRPPTRPVRRSVRVSGGVSRWRRQPGGLAGLAVQPWPAGHRPIDARLRDGLTVVVEVNGTATATGSYPTGGGGVCEPTNGSVTRPRPRVVVAPRPAAPPARWRSSRRLLMAGGAAPFATRRSARHADREGCLGGGSPLAQWPPSPRTRGPLPRSLDRLDDSTCSKKKKKKKKKKNATSADCAAGRTPRSSSVPAGTSSAMRYGTSARSVRSLRRRLNARLHRGTRTKAPSAARKAMSRGIGVLHM